MSHPELGRRYVRHNPALLARPKPPRVYQSEAAKSWSDDELLRLISVIGSKAGSDDVIGKRDLALLIALSSDWDAARKIILLHAKDIRVDDVVAQ